MEEKTTEKPPKFSVIVPVYDRTANLKALCTSIVNQNYENFECLLMNNNPDKAADFQQAFESFKDSVYEQFRETYRDYPEEGARAADNLLSKFKEVPMERCLAATARTEGVKRSVGDWFLVVDGDDSLVKGALAKAAAELEKAGGTDKVSVLKWEAAELYAEGDAKRGDKYYKSHDECVNDNIPENEPRPYTGAEYMHKYIDNFSKKEGEADKDCEGIATWRYIFNANEYRDKEYTNKKGEKTCKFEQPPVLLGEDSASIPLLLSSAEKSIVVTDILGYNWTQDKNSITQKEGLEHSLKLKKGLLVAETWLYDNVDTERYYCPDRSFTDKLKSFVSDYMKNLKSEINGLEEKYNGLCNRCNELGTQLTEKQMEGLKEMYGSSKGMDIEQKLEILEHEILRIKSEKNATDDIIAQHEEHLGI